jgi:penicillin-binding protein 2
VTRPPAGGWSDAHAGGAIGQNGRVPAETRGLRLGILGIVVVSLFVALFGRLWFLQVNDRVEYEQVAAANQVREVQVPPMRGRILDRSGRILADNRRSLSVVIDRATIRNKSVRDGLFLRFAGALGTTPEALEKRYNSDQYDPFLPLPLAEDIDEGVAVFLKERREDYPDLQVQERWQRVYRFAPLASHVIGYVGRLPAEQKDDYVAKGYVMSDLVGRAGVEAAYEEVLRGKPGYIKYEVDSRNRVVQIRERQEPEPGYDLQLAIDLEVQQDAEQLVVRGLEEARQRSPRGKPEVRFAAPAGSAVVLDPRNGEVIALATYPTYDNRWFIGGIGNEKFQQLFPDGPRSPLVNRAISGRYQLGSTMKLFTSIAGLETGALPSPYHQIVDTGYYEIPNCQAGQICRYKNAGNPPARYGAIDLATALTVSSDVFFYQLGVDIYQRPGDLLQDAAREFGLGGTSGIDLPNEHAGMLPDAQVKAELAERGVISEDEGRGFYTGDNLQLAIGQGLLTATPLQLANGYATFANGGTLWKPMIALAVLKAGAPTLESGVVDLSAAEVVERFEPQKLNEVVIPQEWRDSITKGLMDVITSPRGTAHGAFSRYDQAAYPVAGKTGTAQDGTRKDERDSSLFAAWGPVRPGQAPEYAIAAVMEQAGFGAWTAAPVVKCLFEGITGKRTRAPVQQSDRLDRTSDVVAKLPPIVDDACLFVPNTGQD